MYVLIDSHIDAHGLKIQGGSSDFRQNPWGGTKLSVENCQCGPFLGFIAFLLASFFENLPGGAVSSPPPCMHLWIRRIGEI